MPGDALCSRCGERPRQASHRWCRQCNRENLRQWRRQPGNSDGERRRQKLAAMSESERRAFREADKARTREARKRNPEASRARAALQRAVRSGKIIKPKRCWSCGRKTPARQLHGHHLDYKKPLLVVWLCRLCHGARHWTDKRET